MRNRWFHPPLLHSPALGLEKKATWLELFYDLIFVAAFIQLGNGLSANVSLAGAGTFAGMFVPLWVAWTGFTFFENRFTIDDFVHRNVVLLQMFSVGAMAISAPLVFTGRILEFALSAGFAQLLVGAMYARAYAQTPDARDYCRFWGLIFAGGGAIWLVSALLPPEVAVLTAGLSTLGLLASPLSPQSRALSARFPIDFEHLGERYGLLTIIVLGESFVKMLTSLTEDESGLSLYLRGGAALLLTCGIWWVYFDDIAGSAIRTGPGQWVVWLYAHIPLQIAITAVGVAIKKAVHFHWDEPAPDKYRLLLAGALSLVYFAVAAIDSVTERRQAELSDRARVNARAASAIVLLALVPAGRAMSGGAFLSFVLLICVAQVIFDMMMAPFEQSERAELGARTTAELAKEDLEQGRRTARVRRDVGEAVRKGAPSELRRDLYFYFIEGSWWRLGAAFTFLFALSNIFFAALYLVEPGSIAGSSGDSFAEAFHFSVQTMSTIGYGTMSPQTQWGHAVVAVEALVAMVGVAVMTGLVFAKLSRPRSGVLFSKPLVLTQVDGRRVLMFRVGNTRGNEVVDASLTFTALVDVITPEGHHFRRMHDLRLTRSRSPLFRLTWAVMHPLDEDSPLRDTDWKNKESAAVALVATFLGHDGTYAQTTYARHTYTVDDLRVAERFVDIIHELPDGRMMVDYERFHDTRPEDRETGD